MLTPARYLAWSAATMAVLAVLTFAFTVAVDPYYTFGTEQIAGFNGLKNLASNQAVSAKTYQLERTHPRTLLLGNSRVAVGLDPMSPEWPRSMLPVFNAGLSGRDLSIAARVLQDALADGGLRNVIVGLDVLDFLGPEAPVGEPDDAVTGGPDGERMRVDSNMRPSGSRPMALLRDWLSATFTLDALADSILTVLAQGSLEASTMTPLGFEPLREYAIYASQHGFRSLFTQKQAQYAARFPHYVQRDFADPYQAADFRSLRAIIQSSVKYNCQLVLIIYPYHAWVLDLLRQNGLWPSFEAWKRALVRVVAELGQGRVRIVDFSGYNSFAVEAVPAASDLRTKMHWYWEAGHFQSALGDRMIARLYGHEKGFGRELTPATIDSVLEAIR
ncbi:MAG: hypothetical protein JO212_04620, partial [Acetobacteraceae bacterium]|nr:hypothetical protein [Acetobacteraceae bacterium]